MITVSPINMSTLTFLSFVIIKFSSFCSFLHIFCSFLQHFVSSLLNLDFFARVELSLSWENIQLQKEIPEPEVKIFYKMELDLPKWY